MINEKQTMYLAVIAIILATVGIGMSYYQAAGPEGPAGPAGPAGPQGPAGEPGVVETPSMYGAVEGIVLNAQGDPVQNVRVEVEGQSVSATTDSNGVFELEDVESGFAYIYANAPSDAYLDSETLNSVYVGADSTVSGVEITLSGRPSDDAEFVGMSACVACHESQWPEIFEALDGSPDAAAHSRFVTEGTSQMVYPEMWPNPGEDNLVPLDPSGEPLMVQDPLDGEGLVNVVMLTADGVDGREYWFKFFPELAEGATPRTMSQLEHNTGTPKTGFPDSANDPVWIPVAATIGGQGNWGEGYVDPDHLVEDNPTNFGEGKQRYMCRIQDVPYLVTFMTEHGIPLERAKQDYVSYMPVYLVQDGTPVGSDALAEGDYGTPKFWEKGPAHWCPPTNTLSRGCSGCHTTGTKIEYTTIEDGEHTYKGVVTAFDYKDLDMTCEKCHGPGSDHVSGDVDAIISPQHLSVKASNELCGQCHASHVGKSKTPAGIFKYAYDANYEDSVGNGYFLAGIYDLADSIYSYDLPTNDNNYKDGSIHTWPDQIHSRAHSQQLPELLRSAHINNPYERLTCFTCHDSHSLDVPPKLTVDEYVYERPAYDDNTLCLGCHATHGPFADVSKMDVAAIQSYDGRTTTKDGEVLSFEATEIGVSRDVVSRSVGAHMAEIGMGSLYTPDDPEMPVGSCTSCHMPKIGKLFDLPDDGQWHLDFDANGNIAVAEGNLGSHVFDIVWPSQSAVTVNPDLSAGHDYDVMPNSCSKCHDYARISGDLD